MFVLGVSEASFRSPSSSSSKQPAPNSLKCAITVCTHVQYEHGNRRLEKSQQKRKRA